MSKLSKVYNGENVNQPSRLLSPRQNSLFTLTSISSSTPFWSLNPKSFSFSVFLLQHTLIIFSVNCSLLSSYKCIFLSLPHHISPFRRSFPLPSPPTISLIVPFPQITPRLVLFSFPQLFFHFFLFTVYFHFLPFSLSIFNIWRVWVWCHNNSL